MLDDHPVLDWRTQLAERLRIARGAESQCALGARAGVSDRTISFIELEKLANPPRPETVARLAVATGHDPSEWLTLIGAAGRGQCLTALRTRLKAHSDAAQGAFGSVLSPSAA